MKTPNRPLPPLLAQDEAIISKIPSKAEPCHPFSPESLSGIAVPAQSPGMPERNEHPHGFRTELVPGPDGTELVP